VYTVQGTRIFIGDEQLGAFAIVTDFLNDYLGRRGVAGVSANEYSCAHEAQINLGDLTPYLTYLKPFPRF
jgi:hypothetical protein